MLDKIFLFSPVAWHRNTSSSEPLNLTFDDMKTFFIVLALFALATLIHEIGHFILLKIYRIPVKKVQVFYLELFEINLNSFRFALGILPIGGFTEYSQQKFNLLNKTERISVAFAGIFIHAIVVFLGHYFQDFGYWYYINLWKLILNVIPMPGNDAFQILDIIFDGKFYRRRK